MWDLRTRKGECGNLTTTYPGRTSRNKSGRSESSSSGPRPATTGGGQGMDKGVELSVSVNHYNRLVKDDPAHLERIVWRIIVRPRCDNVGHLHG